ncbi:autotransporter outer membrane beta-barrel domain-containing protein [Helicobacter cappadocius]|uniref:Autotransporter outer membrane beta-barrel domain-containing protein n=1 Tax=Helicobacter cappadocius TaxID=3063998 RepID=A0AA90TBV9_9HELI|nr:MULTISPECIES: autotransporter outer membrane beta-barrel domain-containing protein [unclassified Helicobacter]MDO7253273.1 autotransporter outer membrane beta-barrel domain-containing protein [Helicobacter sp. faydin-H75]MDP2539196.1 autotransporter outer membrane beta-barrel domain-containing protein [Helicobacter sp. faydin-H76]
MNYRDLNGKMPTSTIKITPESMRNLSFLLGVLVLITSFLFPTYLRAEIVSFGSSTCSSTSSDSCIGGTYDKIAKGDDPKHTSYYGELEFKPGPKILSFKFYGDTAFIETLNVKSKILILQGSFSGSGIKQGTFTNASLYGDYYNESGPPAVDVPTKMDFVGHSDEDGSGIAFSGNIKNYNGISIWTFKDDANMQGSIQANASGTSEGMNTITFTDSSLNGNISNGINSTPSANSIQRVSQTISFSGNSKTFDYALKGDISTIAGYMNVSFSNDARMIGDVKMSEDGKMIPYGKDPTPSHSTELKFTNSSLTGNITQDKTGKRLISFSGNQSKDGYAMKGSITNQGGDLSAILDAGAIWEGDDSGVALNNSSTTAITIKPSSAIRGDINNADGTLKLDFDTSYQTGTFNLSGGSTTITTLNKSSLGDFAGSGMLTLSLDGSSAGNIENSNVSSTITFKDTLTTPPTDLSSSGLQIGGIDFNGKLTGEIKYYNVGDINNHNSSDTDMTITSSKVGNISNVNKLAISSSSTGDITNNDTKASLTLSSMSDQSIGNVVFAGTLNAVFDKTNTKNISNTGGNTTLSLSNGSQTGSISTISGSTTISADNSNIDGDLSNSGTLSADFKNTSILKGNLVTNNGNSNVSFENGTSMLGSLVGLAGSSNAIFSSDVSKISFASTDTFFPKSDSGSSVDVSTMSDDEKSALISSITPAMLTSYLNASGISNYGGMIDTQGGVNKVDFQDSLYLGGAINTTGGVANITLSFSNELITKLKSNPLTKAFLYEGSGPEFFVNTSSGTSNIALSGDIKGIAHFNYTGGNTNILFSDTIKKDTTTAVSATSKSIGDTTDFNDPASFDPTSSDTTKTQVKVNGHIFQDGLLIRLDAAKAESILAPYRDVFSSNMATFHIDKITDSTTYSAKISGVVVGEVDSLNSSGSTTPKNYEAVLDENAAFIGNLNISDRNISIEFSKGSKLILLGNSNITKLSSNDDNAPSSVDFDNIIGDTLNQKNAVVDLATQGIPSSTSNIRTSFSTLNIKEVDDLSHTVFRLAYNPNVDTSETTDKKADHIIIDKVSNSTDQELTNYLQVFQNSEHFLVGDLSKKNIIVLSVANDSSTGNPNIKFNESSSVQQGYDVIYTTFQSKQENSSSGDPVIAPPPAESTDLAVSSAKMLVGADATTSPTDESTDSPDKTPVILPWTNYYIKSADVHINKANQDMTQAAISTNYNIFLSNINDLNKRLGELRGNSNAQGAWGRIFNGMSTSNRGEEVTTYATNIQGGYDFSIPHSGARSYFGAALSYGYNVLNGTDFTGKAQSIELGAYYSFVSEEGFYTDTILKYAFIMNKLSLPKNQNIDNNLNSSTISLGEEFGYRWNFLLKDLETSRHSLYLEPQAEFVFGYVGNGSFDQINGRSYLNSKIDNILAFRGRVGGVVGYALKTASNQTDFRLGLSYVGDVAGGGNIYLKTNFSQAQQSVSSNQMAMLSFGVNSILSQKWRVYADIDTSFLGKYYNQTYLVSVGGRYAFGKQTLNKQSVKIKQAKQMQEPQKETSSNDVKLPSGYYWVVYALENNSKLTPNQEKFIRKYPYKVSYEYQTIKDASGKSKKILFRYYLLGGFKTKEGALKNQNIANKIAEILNKKNIKAILKEIK